MILERNRPASPFYRSGIAEGYPSDKSRLTKLLYGTLEVKGQCIDEGRMIICIERRKKSLHKFLSFQIGSLAMVVNENASVDSMFGKFLVLR